LQTAYSVNQFTLDRKKMALSLGFKTPQDLLGKVARDLNDLDSAIAAQDEGRIADALYNFSVSITSVKDWLKSHSSSSYTPNHVEALVAGSVALSSFRDVANVNKHRFITRYTPTTDDALLSAPSLQFVPPDAGLGLPKQPFRVKIIRTDGARLEAGALARTAFEELKAFMTRHGV
jgi:hypothetical protein